MDSKTAIMSALLVGLLISSSLAVFFAVDNPDSNLQCEGEGETWGPGIGPPPEGCEEGNPPEDGSQNNDGETSTDDRTPTLFVGGTNFSWGEPVLLSGWVVDEFPSSTTITASVYSADSLSTPSLVKSSSSNEEGVWEILLPYDTPGTWAVQFVATDEVNQSSETKIVNVNLNFPIEEMVLVTLRYQAPQDNDTTGLIMGDLVHLFPSDRKSVV